MSNIIGAKSRVVAGTVVWHEQIGDPTLADGILDRLVHNAHRIEMKGDSMRKNRTKQGS